jgi:hypothetical protein
MTTYRVRHSRSDGEISTYTLGEKDIKIARPHRVAAKPTRLPAEARVSLQT